MIQQQQYRQQLNDKKQRLKVMMAPFCQLEPEVFASPVNHYRMRAEFRIWHEGDDLFHIMFDPQSKQRIRIDSYPIASQLINRMMSQLIEELKKSTILKYKLFQVDYLSTLSNKIIVSLLYHKKLDQEWQEAAKNLKLRLQQQGFDVQLIGRASKQKICFDVDYVDEVLPVAGKQMIYRQIENSFTQPNAEININMLEWAIDVTQGAKGDLLELYCGNGNFSLALSRNFNRVLATEIATPSVEAAQYNIKANGINNVQIIRMSDDDFSQAIQEVREFYRLRDVDLKSYQCETVFVDPPRSGLSINTLEMVKNYPNILYISCNPTTLCENLSELQATHQIQRLALFDQFPYTHHMECGVLLKRR